MNQSTDVQVQQLRHQMSDVIDIIRCDRIDAKDPRSITQTIRRLENHVLGNDENPITSSSTLVKKFSVSANSLSRHASVVDATVLFFVDDFPGVISEQRSDSWKDELSDKEKKSLRNRHSSVKRAVRMAMMHTESFPSQSDRRLKHSLRKVTEKAVEKLRSNCRLPEDETITAHTAANDSGQTSGCEMTVKLPANLPVSWCEAFDKWLFFVPARHR